MRHHAHPGQNSPPAHPPPVSRRERFFAGYVWLITKNLLGWVLIAASFVAGPLVPGPGGIPLFLIGFALISFPGKRRLTARALRGRPVRFRPAPFALLSLGVALVAGVLAMAVLRTRWRWFAEQGDRGALATAGLYLVTVAILWLVVRGAPHVLNLVLRIIARTRRRIRPWLRRHHIHLLPPRWRRRHAHESGSGPLRIKAEILKLYKRPRR